MPLASEHRVTLARHPAAPAQAVRGISARVAKTPDGSLAVSYVIEADIGRLRIAARKAAREADPLWRHTCCELFINCEGQHAYHELNFAHSGAWAAYAFARYREALPLASAALEPHIHVRAAHDRIELDAAVRLDRLSPLHASAKLMLGICAVIEADDGTLSYWALAHPRAMPDFHDARGFALELA